MNILLPIVGLYAVVHFALFAELCVKFRTPQWLYALDDISFFLSFIVVISGSCGPALLFLTLFHYFG
jgi:hypothetical protein